MKALVARHGLNQPELVQVARQTLPPDHVRVAVAAAAFTYFDGFLAAHAAEMGLPEQVGLGFDFSGTVIETGADVHGIGVSDRVAGLHTDITAPVRAHADEVVVPAAAVAVVPRGLDPAIAAAVPLTALAARQALDALGDERGRLLVTGAAGAIGGWLTQLAAREGWSVTALVKPGTDSAITHASVITELSGTYDAVLDAASLHRAALAAVRDSGRYVGFKPSQPQPAERGIAVHTLEVIADGRALDELLPLAAEGAVPVKIAGRAALAKAPGVYEQASLKSGSRGRWLLVP